MNQEKKQKPMIYQRKRYNRQFKEQAIELVRLGKSVPEVAGELEINPNNLYRWINKSSKPAQFGSEGLPAVGEQAAADELRRLRRENSRLHMENNILKKAAVLFATSPHFNAEK